MLQFLLPNWVLGSRALSASASSGPLTSHYLLSTIVSTFISHPSSNKSGLIQTWTSPLHSRVQLQPAEYDSKSHSRSNVATQLFSNAINRSCMFRPAGVSACLPAPQPNGSTSLLLSFLSSTTSASNGNLPPPRGCNRPRRTKWLFEGVTACIRGSEKGAEGGSLCVEGSWQRTRGWREGERA